MVQTAQVAMNPTHRALVGLLVNNHESSTLVASARSLVVNQLQRVAMCLLDSVVDGCEYPLLQLRQLAKAHKGLKRREGRKEEEEEEQENKKTWEDLEKVTYLPY